MARLLAWLSLIAYAAATMHQGEGGGGGKGGGNGGGGGALPFDLGSLGSLNKDGGNQGKGQGKGNGWDNNNNNKGGGNGNGATTVNLVLIWTNQGGGAQNQAMNDPQMQQGAVTQVTVGGEAGLVYSPESVMAQPGDMIQFNFMAKNHTVTQSTFGSPCSKMEAGFDSGFMPNPDNTVDPPPAMMFQVTTAEPTWMYCAQGTHCEKGMVFSVNPTAEKSQEAFKQKAMQSGGGGGGGNGGGKGMGGGNATAPQQAQPSIATGQGQQGNGGQCSCACLCGTSAFPAGAGMGGWGGMSGSMKMSAIGGGGK